VVILAQEVGQVVLVVEGMALAVLVAAAAAAVVVMEQWTRRKASPLIRSAVRKS